MTVFNPWAHRIQDGGTQRLDADRLVDRVNVKDFGALGQGASSSTADTTAVGAAITAAANGGGKIVVFPSGEYNLTSPVKNNVAGTIVGIEGQGYRTTAIMAAGAYSIDNLGAAGKIVSVSDTRVDGIRMAGVTSGLIDYCDLKGGGLGIAANLANTSHVTIRNTGINGPGGSVVGPIGVITGDYTSMYNVNGHGFWEYMRASGKGLLCMGCTSETCKTGLRLGINEAGSSALLDGFFMMAYETERNDTAVEFWNARDGLIIASQFQGTVGVGVGLANDGGIDYHMSGWVFGGGVLTVTSIEPIRFVGNLVIKMDNPGNSGPYQGYHVATALDAQRFSFPTAVNTGFSSTTTWSTAQTRIIDVPPTGVVNNVRVHCCTAPSVATVAGVDLSRMSAGSSILFGESWFNLAAINNGADGFSVPTWLPPPNAARPDVDLSHTNHFDVTTTAFPFANLPGSPREGDEYSITDGSASLVPRAIVTGGGSLHAKVRWTGSNWVLMGK